MGAIRTFVRGLGIGAGLMYLYDPTVGRRRRARLQGRVTRLAHRAETTLDYCSRDLGNRWRGFQAELTGMLTESNVTDEKLAARVRSKLGHVVSHPRAIDVEVSDGKIMLSGPVMAEEVDSLIRGVSSVRGVAAVDHRLDVHDEPANISTLQGGAHEPANTGPWPSTPGTQLCVGLGGAALTIYALRRPALTATVLATAGYALLRPAADEFRSAEAQQEENTDASSEAEAKASSWQ